MRHWFVNILLTCSIAVVLMAYSNKSKSPDHIDYMAESLKALNAKLPENSIIHYEGVASDPVNGWEVPLFARFLVAPRVLGSEQKSNFCLVIFRKDNDSSGTYVSSAAQKVWEHHDSVYHYTLIRQ
jgi:hypothetical protein